MTTAFGSVWSRTHKAAGTSGGTYFAEVESELLRKMFTCSFTPITIRLTTTAPPSSVVMPLGLIRVAPINRENRSASEAAKSTQADPFQASHPAKIPESVHAASDISLCPPTCLIGPNAPTPCIQRQLAIVRICRYRQPYRTQRTGLIPGEKAQSKNAAPNIKTSQRRYRQKRARIQLPWP